MAKPWRETPLIESASLSRAAGWCAKPPPDERGTACLIRSSRVFSKLDIFQPSGSFKSRGIGNLIISHLAKAKAKYPTPESSAGTNTLVDGRQQSSPVLPPHFYCSSGGNAGLACVTAATSLGYASTVVVPESSNPMMVDKMRAAGASDVIVHGAGWMEADKFLREEVLTKDAGGVYVPPFDHPDIWAGNATLVEEIARQFGDVLRQSLHPTLPAGSETPDAIVCSVGGGGLLNGIVQGKIAASLNAGDGSDWASVPVIAVETSGADSLAQALEAKELITIPAITSQATSLGSRRVSEQTFAYGMDPRYVVEPIVFTDDEAARACVRLSDEERIMVELACSVSAAVFYDEQKRLQHILTRLGRWKGPDTKVVLIVCGGSIVTSAMLEKWRRL